MIYKHLPNSRLYIDTHAFASSARVAAATFFEVNEYVRPVAVEGLTSVSMSDGSTSSTHPDAVDTHI